MFPCKSFGTFFERSFIWFHHSFRAFIPNRIWHLFPLIPCLMSFLELSIHYSILSAVPSVVKVSIFQRTDKSFLLTSVCSHTDPTVASPFISASSYSVCAAARLSPAC